MIPTSVEQTPFRQPFYELLVAWGGDLALSGGVIGCTATASSAAAGHAASSVNNGDRTLLNSNWWESTNAYGKAFSPSVDGYIFRDTLANLSAWTAEYTVGASIGTHTSVANSPFMDMTISSTVINTLSMLFRRCTTNLPFNTAARTFAFTLKSSVTRHHVASGSDFDGVRFMLCPTIVTATDPGAEQNLIAVWISARENWCELNVRKVIAGVATTLVTVPQDAVKTRNMRITVDSTNLTIWDSKDGVLFSGAHGFTMANWTACYIYTSLWTYNTELAAGSVGNIFVEGGSNQVFGSLAAQTLIQLQASELMNADFSLIQNQYATQEIVEDFERFTAGAAAYDWVTGAASGNKTCTTEDIAGYSRGLRLYNDADQYTWTQLLTRWGSDFEASWNIYLPVYSGMSENFESYSIGESMTSHGWVNYDHGASAKSFAVVAGKYGYCTSGVGWSAWRYEAGYWWQNWADYTVDFDVKATAGGRFGCVVRHTSGGGYVVQGLPGVANELTLRSCNANDPLAAQTNLTAANCPAQVNHVTINVLGTRIRVWIDGALLIDYTDASNLHPTGSFTVISYNTGWTLDNLAISMAISVSQFNQVIRCDTSFNQCYVLKHSPNAGQFFLCRDMTAGSGQVTTLVTTAFNYDLYGTVRKHNVRVVAKQAVIQVWIDGTQVANYTDATPRLGGFFGLQLKSGGGAGWGYIDNLVIKPLSCTLPEYWENLNGFYGHALPVRYDQIVLYAELGQNRTSAGANNWFWQDRSGAWAVGVFDRDQRGGYLQSNCNATGTAQTGDTSIQSFDLPFYVLTAGTYYINVHDVVSSDGGQYQVLVDGGQIGGDIDQYNASAAMRWVRPSTPSVSLAAGSHTLTIRKLATKNGSSTNYYVRMDEIILTQASAAISGNPQTRSQYPAPNYASWVFDNNLVQLTATEAQMQTGIQPGIKQEIKFPRNQNVTAVFRVSSPNSGIKVKVGDTVTGIEQESMLNTGDTMFTFTLNRTFLEGAQGSVYLYISALPNGVEKGQLNIHKVDVWADTACNDRVKFLEAPYTAGTPTVGGTLQYKKSNLLLEPEVFDNSQWGTSGSVTLTANSDLNPLGNGTNAYQAVIASGAYLFQPVDVTFAWRNFTFSVWAKASVSTNVYIGVLDSLTAPKPGQLIQKTVGTSWTRLFISVPYTALVNDTIGEKLYAYIGTNGLGLFSNLGTATIKLFGAQLVENGSSDLLEYYRSTETRIDTTGINGAAQAINNTSKNFQYDTGAVLTNKTWRASLWINTTSPASSGYLYLMIGTDDNSQYAIRKLELTGTSQKFSLKYTFASTARTKVTLTIGTAAIGSYAQLPNVTVDVIKAVLLTETQSDQVEIWEDSQNLLLRSAEFSNASWSKDAGAAVTADQWPNPVDFGQTADLITASIAGHSVYQGQSIVAPASNTFTFSVWLRADTAINVNLEISAVGAVNQSPAITVGKQWARYSYTVTFAGSAEASCWAAIRLATTGSVYAWGAQFEQKPYMTDYVATTSASLSRTANTVSMSTPAALNGTANPFAVSMRCQLLADDLSAARNHTLFAIGNGGTAQKVVVYLASGNFNLYVRDQSGNEYTQTLPIPVGMTLLKEFIFTLWRSGGDWGMVVQDSRGTQATAMLRTTNTTATVLQTIYLGGNTSGAEIGNLRVDDFFVWNRKPTDLEYAALVSQDVDYDYRSSNLPQLYVNALNGAMATYAAGGTATVSMHVKNIMPLPVKLSFWKGDQLECQESDYGVWGGTTWAYNYEWLLLTFNKAATFNRLKLYEYPNADSSLVAPYTSGKGGIKEWYLEYWDATAGAYVPFYRHGGSIDDLEVIDLKQLIANSGFEDSVGGWLPTNPFVTLSQYSGYGVHSGAKSLKVSIAYNTQAATNGIKVPFTFVPGVTYTITAWVAYGTSQPGGTFRMEVIDGVSNPVSATVTPTPQFTWQKLSITYTTDSQAKKNGGWIRIVGYGFPTPPGLAPFVFLVDDVTVTSTAPSVTSTRLRLVMLATQATNDLVIPRVQDTQKIVGLQMFNFTDESQYVKDDDIQITIKKTADTNQIAPSYFQVKLSNITKRFSPKNFQSAIYGYTQPDGRGFVRPGSLVEISGGYIQADGTIFKDRCLKGIIGQEQNPAANTGIELQSTGEEVLLVGGDDMMQLARTVIGESNVLQNQPLEKVLQYVGQLAGFGVQDMQLDMSGTVVPFAWVGGGSTALDIINEILEASNGMFFAYPGLKKTLYYYDGVKFKSWLQTTKTDFDAGTLSNVEDATEPGNVKLNLNTTALIMSFGGWSEGNHMASTYLPNLLALWLKTPTSDATFSVPNYHFNGNSEWTFQLTGLMTATAYANRNQDLGLINYQGQRQSYFGIRTHEAGDNPPQSVVEFANCYFDAKNPQLTLSLVDEAGTVLKSTSVRLYNSGEDSPYCGILPGSGTITNKTIYIMRRRVYSVNGSIVPIYGAVTNVSGPHVIGGTPSGIQVDTLINHGGGWSAAAEDNDWAYDEIWATDSTVTNAPGTTIPCTYYLQGTVNKHDIFTMTAYYTDTRAGYPNDKQYGGVAGRAWNDNYSSYGFRSGWNNVTIDHSDLLAANTGKRVYLQISIPAAAKNPYGVWVPGGTSIVRNTRSVILTPNTYYKFQVRYMLFDVRNVGIYQEQPGKLFIDAVAYGTQQFYNSPDAYSISSVYDTGKVTPIWGSLAWNMLTQLNLSRGEGYQLYSQTSDDNVNWYGQSGLNGWDLIFASASDPYSVSLSARITSPQKRYIRFKAAFQTQDAYTSPIMVSASFTYTVNGFIISQVLDATTGIQSWAGFASSIITPDSTSITFATLSADDAGFTSPDPAGWVTATPGQPIASAVKRYLKWTAFLNTTDGGISPTLADVTINWIKGLSVPSDNRYYSHDTRIESFDPRAGFPACNSCQVSANAYLLVTTTNSITANWNGSGSGTAKTLGQQIGTYSLVPVNLAAATATLEMDLNDPALTTNASGYPSYPRAVVVTIGGVNYGIIGYDAAAIKEGVQFTWAGVGGGNLVMEFHGSGTHLYLTITAAGTVSITAVSAYGYAIKKPDSFTPSQLAAVSYTDATSVALYNKTFLKQIDSRFIYSSGGAYNLAKLNVDTGKWIRDYGQLVIPIEFTVGLQSRLNVNQPNAGWQNQWCEAYEITHQFASMTTRLMVKETT